MRGWRDRTVASRAHGELRVREWPGDGPPLLLLHGFMGSLEEWGDLPAKLDRVRVAAVDLPGHGRSGGGAVAEEYTVPGIARELGALQETLFGGPSWWLGYSMGGRIALAAAAEGVDLRGLLLEGASPGLRTALERAERREVDEARARTLESSGMETFVDDWLTLPLFHGLPGCAPEVRARTRSLRIAQDPFRMAAWLRGAGTGAQPSYWSRLQTLDLPVHLLAGGEDEKFLELAGEMAARIPDATVTVVPGVGHLPHLEAPDAWLDWVRGALDRD